MKVAYFTNQYPKVSHTFIRREIAALETRGFAIERLSIRGTPDQLVDSEDIAEQQRTTVLLDRGLPSLMLQALWTAARHPVLFAEALCAAVRLGARSERGMLRNLAYLMTACTLKRLLAERGCERVHVHFGTNPTAVAMLCRMLGGPPYSFTVHGPEEFDKPAALSLRDKIEGSALVAGVSSFGRSQLYRHCGHAHWPKVHVVRCGVDRSYLDTTPTAAPDTNTLVCVGRLCEQKGQLLLIEAAHRLHKRGLQFRLVLVGDGEMRVDVEALVAEHGLEEHVTITGWASGDEVRNHLLSARAMVLPSFAEGLPVVIMEALALGRPVITTYIAGIPELVVPGKCGWLVPAGSVDALVEAMEAALGASPQQLDELGRDGRRRVLEQHDATKAVEPLVASFLGERG